SPGSMAVAATTTYVEESAFKPGLILVFHQTLTDADGRRLHAEVSVLVVETSAGWNTGTSPRSLRQVVEEVRALGQRPGTSIHEHLSRTLGVMSARVDRLRAVAREA